MALLCGDDWDVTQDVLSVGSCVRYLRWRRNGDPYAPSDVAVPGVASAADVVGTVIDADATVAALGPIVAARVGSALADQPTALITGWPLGSVTVIVTLRSRCKPEPIVGPRHRSMVREAKLERRGDIPSLRKLCSAPGEGVAESVCRNEEDPHA